MGKACWNCDRDIDSKWSSRYDRHFCDNKCVAKYARDNGDKKIAIHTELPEILADNCAVCGDTFSFNRYADRSGQRQPLYCSNACRQKAYRTRRKSD